MLDSIKTLHWNINLVSGLVDGGVCLVTFEGIGNLSTSGDQIKVVVLTWKKRTISAVTCSDIGMRLLYRIRNVRKLNPKCAFCASGTSGRAVTRGWRGGGGARGRGGRVRCRLAFASHVTFILTIAHKSF